MASNPTSHGVNATNAVSVGGYIEAWNLEGVTGPLRAFPGAEGIAALTRGAAGYSGAKSVAFVDNLNDSGSGSLRAAIEGAGKDGTFVIFRTSGVINLSTPITCLSNYITFAGHTSPGGWCTAGNAIFIGNSDNTGLHDFIFRHSRFRPGSHGGASDADMESFRIWSANNIMMDHCSFSWGADETLSITTYQETDPAYNITFSHCIIAEGLTDPAPESNHGYGLLFNGTAGTGGTNSMDLHHSVMAHCNDRMPQISGACDANLINNVIYNPYASQGVKVVPYASRSGELRVNYIGNYVISGPDSNAALSNAGNLTEITLSVDASGVTPWDMLFMENNIGIERLADDDPEWQLSNWWTGALASTDWQSDTEFSISGGVAITKEVVLWADRNTFRDAILADAGATLPVRDSVDANIAVEAAAGTGSLTTDVTYPGDWPTFATPTTPTDTDGDGIPDAYWTYRGISAQTWDAEAPSGYLWIEEYINDLASGDYS